MRKLIVLTPARSACCWSVAAPALASAKTFYVHPSGGNDTANIQAAFNAAVKAGPGSTVQLSAGHFYTNRILVPNFNGTFKGAGQGKTVIDCLRGLDSSLPGVIVKAEPGIVAFPYLVLLRWRPHQRLRHELRHHPRPRRLIHRQTAAATFCRPWSL